MMGPSLLRGVTFAALAGLGAFVVRTLFPVAYGQPSALVYYLFATLILAPCVFAPNRRSALRASALMLTLLAPLALVVDGPRTAFMLGLFVLSLGRSGVAYSLPLGRALFAELALAVPALVLALLFVSGSALSVGMAFWLFWLVQATFTLGHRRTVDSDRVGDPFVRAKQAAESLLQPHV